MQFKRGGTERRTPEYEDREEHMDADTNQAGGQESRSPFSFARHERGGAPRPQEGGQPAEEPAPPPSSAVESVVDSGAVVEGHFQADNDLRIQGTISGEITCRGVLTVERTATARAQIQAQECEILGTIDGDITCSGRLRLASTAVVNATIRAGSLVVEEGASISGSVETNYTGEVTSAASNRRRGSRKNEEPAAEARDAEPEEEKSSGGNRKGGSGNRGREAPSFALVSSDDSAADSRESRSS